MDTSLAHLFEELLKPNLWTRVNVDGIEVYLRPRASLEYGEYDLTIFSSGESLRQYILRNNVTTPVPFDFMPSAMDRAGCVMRIGLLCNSLDSERSRSTKLEQALQTMHSELYMRSFLFTTDYILNGVLHEKLSMRLSRQAVESNDCFAACVKGVVLQRIGNVFFQRICVPLGEITAGDETSKMIEVSCTIDALDKLIGGDRLGWHVGHEWEKTLSEGIRKCRSRAEAPLVLSYRRAQDTLSISFSRRAEQMDMWTANPGWVVTNQ